MTIIGLIPVLHSTLDRYRMRFQVAKLGAMQGTYQSPDVHEPGINLSLLHPLRLLTPAKLILDLQGVSRMRGA